ncbi:hypothetical protein JTB14_021674 [Gonioctena quinquepunctata]|nr:hypothetical protein JTB14_021674 [Gonioctena quinquepunctata]
MYLLESIIEGIKPREGAEPRVVEEAKLPYNDISVAYLPGGQGYSSEKILELIEAQHEKFKATTWRVLRRASEGPLELFRVSIDHQLAGRLGKTGFVMNYKSGHTTLGPKSGKPKGTESGTSDIKQSAVSK